MPARANPRSREGRCALPGKLDDVEKGAGEPRRESPKIALNGRERKRKGRRREEEKGEKRKEGEEMK